MINSSKVLGNNKEIKFIEIKFARHTSWSQVIQM